MRQLELKHGVCIYDDADHWIVSHFKWSSFQAASLDRYYVSANGPKRYFGKKYTVLLHRLLLCAKPGEIVDHANGDSLDNRRTNLRRATRAQNNANSRLHRDNSTGYRGVQWHARDRRWVAEVRIDGRRIVAGSSKDIVEAAHLYDEAARRWFGPFASLNFGPNDAGYVMRRSVMR